MRGVCNAASCHKGAKRSARSQVLSPICRPLSSSNKWRSVWISSHGAALKTVVGLASLASIGMALVWHWSGMDDSATNAILP